LVELEDCYFKFASLFRDEIGELIVVGFYSKFLEQSLKQRLSSLITWQHKGLFGKRFVSATSVAD